MTRRIVTAVAVVALAAGLQAKDESKHQVLTKDARVQFFRSAQVWTPTNVAELDLRSGPPIKGAFTPDQYVECDFVESKPEGSSKKFHCKLADGDVVKVRYGADNGEVEGSVLASRLLWALGFGSGASYPV